MKLLLEREDYLADRTIGKLYIDGEYYCYTLEPPALDKAHCTYRGKGCVPCGTYGVAFNYSPRFMREL